MVSKPSARLTSMSFSSMPGRSAVTSISLSVSETSTFGIETDHADDVEGQGRSKPRQKLSKARLMSFCRERSGSLCSRRTGTCRLPQFQGIRSRIFIGVLLELSGGANVDFLSRGRRGLRQGQPQHAVLEFGIDPVAVDQFGQCEYPLVGCRPRIPHGPACIPAERTVW